MVLMLQLHARRSNSSRSTARRSVRRWFFWLISPVDAKDPSRRCPRAMVRKKMRTKLRLTTLLVGWTLGVPAARGDGALDVPDGGVVAIGGSASEREREVVSAAVATAVRSAGWSLAPQTLTKQDAEGLIDCSAPGGPWECVPASIDASAVHRALVIAVEQQTENDIPLIVLTGKVIATRPAAFMVRQRFCERCADDKLAQTSTELTLLLLHDLAVQRPRTMLEVNSTPTGALITVDGQPAGATDGSVNTFPGLHIVTITKPGFQVETIRVHAESGKTSAVSVTLRANAPLPPPPPPRPSLLVPVSRAGAGVTLSAVSQLIYSYQHGSAGYNYYHPPAHCIGPAATLGGLGAIGAGFYLWWRGSATTTVA